MQQISVACTDTRFSGEKQLNIFQDPLSIMYQKSISRDSEIDMNTTIQCDITKYNNNSFTNNVDDTFIDTVTCLKRNSTVEIVFYPTIVSQETVNNIHEHINNGDVLLECCEKKPVIDTKMIEDLNKALDNPSERELGQIICYIQDLSYDKWSRNPQPNQSIKSLRRKRQYSKEKLLLYLRDIRDKILNRCSYGFMVISKNKDQFLAVRNCHGQHRWSAPKGHIRMKVNYQWETLFEAAVREMAEEIHYWDPKSEQYRTIYEKHLRKYVTYIECVFQNARSKYRRIGLFVICLQDDFQFYPKDLKEIDDVKWFGLQDEIDPNVFYTIYPFVEYLRNHRELFSHSIVDSRQQ